MSKIRFYSNIISSNILNKSIFAIETIADKNYKITSENNPDFTDNGLTFDYENIQVAVAFEDITNIKTEIK